MEKEKERKRKWDSVNWMTHAGQERARLAFPQDGPTRTRDPSRPAGCCFATSQHSIYCEFWARFHVLAVSRPLSLLESLRFVFWLADWSGVISANRPSRSPNGSRFPRLCFVVCAMFACCIAGRSVVPRMTASADAHDQLVGLSRQSSSKSTMPTRFSSSRTRQPSTTSVFS